MRPDQILHLIRGPRVLHVGCADHEVRPGAVDWLHEGLVRAFPGTAGADIHAENLEKMSQAGFNDLHLQDAQSLHLPGRQFDTIVAADILEHLENPGLFLVAARQHLAPGGRLVVTTPSPFMFTNFLYALLHYPKTCQNPEHTTWFCPQTLKNLAARCEFSVIHYEPIWFYPKGRGSRLFRVYAWLMRTPLIPNFLRATTGLYLLTASNDLTASK
jgi:SAM-dependent methyltransferase